MIADTLYYSTNQKSPKVTFREALLKGLAPDGGLYLPEKLPVLSGYELEDLPKKEYALLAGELLYRLIGSDISKEDLISICKEVYNFGIPLEHVEGKSYILHLDQGPTASFKDFAALMMGRLMQYYLTGENRYINILTATSGDTGSAVANAFYGLKNIRAIILFPANEVTDLQRKQMTTFNNNISVIAVDGKFDDCQKLVKKAFMDPELSEMNLSSANSINIGRLLPQSVYYFWAWAQLSGNADEKIVFSVPCGNFGNLAGGLIAKMMGLPVARFIVATNENNEVPLFLETGEYRPIVPSVNCISSAMNVGHPSNLARIVAFYNGRMDETGRMHKMPDLAGLNKDIFAVSISDKQTFDIIKSFYRKYNKVVEPHGAVAWQGLQDYIHDQRLIDEKGRLYVSLETAHPGKFRDEIRRILNIEPELPDSLRKIEAGKEEFISLEDNYDILKKYLIHNY